MLNFIRMLRQFTEDLLHKTLIISKTDYTLLWNLYQKKNITPELLLYCEYTQKIAPSDARITMIIGCLRLLQSKASASEAFGFLAQKYPSSLCHFLLIASHTFFSHWALAHDACKNFLSQFTPPSHPIFEKTLSLIIKNIPDVFFTAFSLTGKITLYCHDYAQLNDLTVTLDQYKFVLQPARNKIIIRLPSDWKSAKILTVSAKNKKNIRYTFNIPTFLHVRGFAEISGGHITGWVCCDTDPERDISLLISSMQDKQDFLLKRIKISQKKYSDVSFLKEDSEKHYFSFFLSDLRKNANLLFVKTDNGKNLYGSPVSLSLFQNMAYRYALETERNFPAIFLTAPDNTRETLPLDLKPACIIVPVYNGFTATQTCLQQLKKFKPASVRLILVNDASTDRRIHSLLFLYQKLIPDTVIIQHQRNQGFPATANTGLKARYKNEDVLLLNSDTIVSERFFQKLQLTAYITSDIGTVTPLSNSATIFSYPEINISTPVPTVKKCAELDQLAEKIWQSEVPEVPTAHGFCMYIKEECLQETGLFRYDAFAQGYGEENDFSRRAAALGWRHVACPGVYVGHAEGQSFSSVKKDLIRHNLKILNAMHPGYDELVQSWLRCDPLLPFRRMMDIALFSKNSLFSQSVLLVTHDRAGGLSKHIGERAKHYLVHNIHPFSLKPITSESGVPLWKLEDIPNNDYRNLILPRSAKALNALLRKIKCSKIEIHSYIGHGIKKIYELTSLDIPYDVFIHDYSWFCPRITLTTPSAHYCGEPGLTCCQACFNSSSQGDTTGDTTRIKILKQYTHKILKNAQKNYAPSKDAGERICRQLNIKPSIRPWEKISGNETLTFTPRTKGKNRHVGIMGAIGPEKGYYQLLHLAQLAATINAPVHFILVGYSCNDQELLATGKVTITGPYQEYEITELTNKHCIDWFFLPSVWPETWSYVLTQIWTAMRPVIAYDIGAQAERIRKTHNGTVVPLHTRPLQLLIVLHNPSLWATQQSLPSPGENTLPPLRS